MLLPAVNIAMFLCAQSILTLFSLQLFRHFIFGWFTIKQTSETSKNLLRAFSSSILFCHMPQLFDGEGISISLFFVPLLTSPLAVQNKCQVVKSV